MRHALSCPKSGLINQHVFKVLPRPVVGDLELPFESFPIPAASSQSLLTYTTEPGSPSHDALNLLASWAATTDGSEQAAPADDSKQPGSVRDA
jgi:MmyB-like transcription regulator ligand binding domain